MSLEITCPMYLVDQACLNSFLGFFILPYDRAHIGKYPQLDGLRSTAFLILQPHYLNNDLCKLQLSPTKNTTRAQPQIKILNLQPTILPTQPNLIDPHYHLLKQPLSNTANPNQFPFCQFLFNILPMPIFAKDCFSYPALLSQIQLWDIPQNVALKLAECSFKVALPQLSAEWMSLTRHSLVYYLLKQLEYAFLEVRPHWIIQHSHAMKHHYSQLVIKHESDFDLKLIIAVKTIAHFIAMHLHHLLADLTLENDIYQLIVLNLLGLALEPSAYPTLLKTYTTHSQPPKTHNPPTPINIRHSHDVQILTNVENSLAGKLKPLQLVSRRHGKKQTADHISVGDCNLEQIKSELKENLYVKPPSKPRTPKFTIHQLRQLQLNPQQHSPPQQHSILQQKPDSEPQTTNKKVFLSNQLSNAFEFNTDLKLNDVKKFPIQRSVAKLQPLVQSFYKIIKSTDKRLEIKREESRTKCQVSKAGVKSVKNWGQIITSIKNELYTGKHKNLNRKQKTNHNYDQETDQTTPQPVQITAPHQTKLNNSSESVKFRKLNLMNSPNVVIVGEGVENEKQVQVLPIVTKTHSLFQMKSQFWQRGSHLQANRRSKGRLLYRNSSIAELQKY